jgi:hypothetical protein
MKLIITNPYKDLSDDLLLIKYKHYSKIYNYLNKNYCYEIVTKINFLKAEMMKRGINYDK